MARGGADRAALRRLERGGVEALVGVALLWWPVREQLQLVLVSDLQLATVGRRLYDDPRLLAREPEHRLLDALQTRLRRINSVETLLPRSTPRLYKKFRRDKERAATWYKEEPARSDDICWQEIDLLVLLLLRSCTSILAAYGNGGETPVGAIFGRVRSLYKSQVLVDEATDAREINDLVKLRLDLALRHSKDCTVEIHVLPAGKLRMESGTNF